MKHFCCTCQGQESVDCRALRELFVGLIETEVELRCVMRRGQPARQVTDSLIESWSTLQAAVAKAIPFEL